MLYKSKGLSMSLGQKRCSSLEDAVVG